AMALQVYARQAKDMELVEHATDIRMRAERRAGELLKQMGERGERHSGHGDQKSGSQATTPKLEDLGISKSQSSRGQGLASLDDKHFEARVQRAKGWIGGAMDAAAAGHEPTKREAKPKPDMQTAAYELRLEITKIRTRLMHRLDDFLAVRDDLTDAVCTFIHDNLVSLQDDIAKKIDQFDTRPRAPAAKDVTTARRLISHKETQ